MCGRCEHIVCVEDTMVRFRQEVISKALEVDTFWGKVRSLFRSSNKKDKSISTNTEEVNKSTNIFSLLKRIANKIKEKTAVHCTKKKDLEQITSPQKIGKKKTKTIVKLKEVSSMFSNVPYEELKTFLEIKEIAEISDSDELYSKVIDKFL